MSSQGPWRALLQGEAAAATWQAIVDIADALATPAERPQWAGSVSLAGGSAGVALFLAYLAASRRQEAHTEAAVGYLEHSMEVLEARPMAAGLYAGFGGIGWTVAHLEGRLLDRPERGEDGLDELCQVLARRLREPAETGRYDLIDGLVGLGICAFECLPRPAARQCLELLVLRLAELAEDVGDGATWFTPPAVLPPGQLQQAPHGYYNVGVAHGVPAVIAVLGRAAGLGLDVLPLLERAVAWLLAQELEDGAESRFPSWVGEGVEPRTSRLAWCYGDAGLAAALLLAARCVGREDWQRQALRIARRAAGRRLAGSGIRDAGLCHGTAGLTHLFNRLYQATGEEAMAEACRYWLELTLGLRRPDQGIAGYRAWSPLANGEMGWQAEPGFLSGAAGVGLALLAAVAPIEPEWDRVLVCSIPPLES